MAASENPWLLAILGTAIMLTVSAMFPLAAWWRRRSVAEMQRDSWKRCPYCFFDLNGSPDEGACPECGERYEIGAVQTAWRGSMFDEK
jgi:hypothetical protein